MNEILNQLTEYLKQNDCYDLQPCSLKLGNSILPAVEYKQDRNPLPGARNQNPYTIHGFYVIGQIPTKRKAYYLYNGLVWYVAGYYQQVNPEYNEYHPFGKNFLLFPSILGDSILDKSPDRVKMTVHYEEA